MHRRLSTINPATDQYLPFLLFLFFGSGFAALIYEVIWLQMLQLVIGLTSLSLGVLLGTFMGGMCIGSLLLPGIISRNHHPLRVYGFLEIGIGISGLLILFGMPLIENFYTAIAGYGLFRSVLLRSSIAVICLLPPTILMGATLPAISRWVNTTPTGVSWMGYFYGGNIFGAVAGSLLAGFYLLRIYDISIATYVAFSMNLLVALCAFMISRISSYNHIPAIQEFARSNHPKSQIIYVTIALSGMAALGSEVIWTRLLSIIFGSTVYTFSIILGAFLIGLGIGSAAGSYLSRILKHPAYALGVCQFLLIIAIAWTSYIITRSLPYKPLDLSTVSSSWYQFEVDLGRSVLAVLPAAILWGASFPLAIAALASDGQDPGRLVGGVYASNTIGAIIGSLAFSLVGIPVLGTAASQKLLIVISAVSALLMLYYIFQNILPTRSHAAKKKLPLPDLRFAGLSAGILILTFVIISKITTVPWFAVAFGRFMINYNNLQSFSMSPSSSPDTTVTPIYFGEGLNGSVVVTQLSTGVRQFHSVGKVQASTDPSDMRLQRMLGHITGLLTRDPESVLIVGCGAGITAGTFLTYPEVKKILICDIEPLVPKVIAPMFSRENYGIADGIEKENPHIVNGKEVGIINDDGRHYVSTSHDKFDIISSDPIDPWAKGAAALYTEEFFKICKAHLNPGGSVSLWVPLYENSAESVKSMISTFFAVFPDGIIWSNDNEGIGYDLVLFGQAEPLHIDIEKLEKRFNREDYAPVRQSLEDVGFYSLEDLLGTYAGRARDLKEWMADAQINTDRNLRLSYLAGLAINSVLAADIFFEISSYFKIPEGLFTGSEQKIDSLYLTIENKFW